MTYQLVFTSYIRHAAVGALRGARSSGRLSPRGPFVEPRGSSRTNLQPADTHCMGGCICRDWLAGGFVADEARRTAWGSPDPSRQNSVRPSCWFELKVFPKRRR